MKKNDIITAEIVDYSLSDGNGIAKYNDMVIFVPATAVGDICEIKIIKDINTGINDGDVLKIGKKVFVKLKTGQN